MATVTVSRPNFLGSEIGLVTKTVGLDYSTNSALATSEVDAQGFVHYIVKAGTQYGNSSLGIYGLVFQDVDITGTNASAQAFVPVMTAGRFINDTTHIPVAVASSGTTITLAQAQAQGLFPVSAASAGDGTITRNVSAESL